MLQIWDAGTIIRDSSVLKSPYLLIIKENRWLSKKAKKNLIFFEILRKIRIFRQFSGFLTYVNFSLSAKFNRFFIILGGIEEMDQKSWIFKKSRKNVVFRGFQENRWFFIIFEKFACFQIWSFFVDYLILGKSGIFGEGLGQILVYVQKSGVFYEISRKIAFIHVFLFLYCQVLY